MMKKGFSLFVLAAMAFCLPQFAHAKGAGSSTKIGVGYASAWPGAAMSGPSLRIGLDDLTLGLDTAWGTTDSKTETGSGTAVDPKITTTGSATNLNLAGRIQLPLKREKAVEVYLAPGVGVEIVSSGDRTTTIAPPPTPTTGVVITKGGSTTNVHVFGVFGFAYDLGFFNAPNVKLALEGGLDLAFGSAGKYGFQGAQFSVIGGAFHYYF